MNSFNLTAKAKADLIEIAKYTEKKWSKEQRNFYLKQFDDAFNMISKNPNAGTKCDYIKIDYLKFLQGSHIIFYKKNTTKQIEIVRILHKRMDILASLN